MDHCEHEWDWIVAVGAHQCRCCLKFGRYPHRQTPAEIIDLAWDIAQ